MLLSDVCLSVAYVGPKLRTERPRKTKIGTEVAHFTCDSDTAFKVKVTRPLCSPPCWHIRQLQRWAWERVGHGKLLLRFALCLMAQDTSAPMTDPNIYIIIYYLTSRLAGLSASAKLLVSC